MPFAVRGRLTIIKYFAEKISWIDAFKFICYEKSYQKNAIYMRKKLFNSKRINLSCSPEELLSSFKANTRNEIRKGMKLGVSCNFNELMQNVISIHQELAREKNHNADTVINDYKGLDENIICTSVSLENEILAVHSYLLDSSHKTVFLKSSASKYRSLDKETQKLIGIANRYLHYQDMLFFRNINFDYYDLGGYANDISNPELKNINDFKDSFCGENISYYNYISYPYILLSSFLKFFSMKI